MATKNWNSTLFSEAAYLLTQMDERLSNIKVAKTAQAEYINTCTGPCDYFYIAGPWFKNKDRKLMEIFHKYFTKIYSHAYFPLYDSDENATPKQAYEKNIIKLNACSEVIAFVSTFDTGTAFEIGYAKSLGKTVKLLCWNERTFIEHGTNIMLAFAADNCYEFENYLTSILTGVNPTSLIINNSWRSLQ